MIGSNVVFIIHSSLLPIPCRYPTRSFDERRKKNEGSCLSVSILSFCFNFFSLFQVFPCLFLKMQQNLSLSDSYSKSTLLIRLQTRSHKISQLPRFRTNAATVVNRDVLKERKNYYLTVRERRKNKGREKKE